MFCTNCGVELREKDRYCFECGTPAGGAFRSTHPREALSRPVFDRKIAGVCAGFARYFNVDVTLVRIFALVLLFWPVPLIGSIAYLIAWLVMPRDPIEVPQRREAQVV
jgi:phage shock protein C